MGGTCGSAEPRAVIAPYASESGYTLLRSPRLQHSDSEGMQTSLRSSITTCGLIETLAESGAKYGVAGEKQKALNHRSNDTPTLAYAYERGPYHLARIEGGHSVETEHLLVA